MKRALLRFIQGSSLAIAISASVFAQTAPSVRILLPERTRLLQGQLVDVVLEVRNASSVNGLKVTAGATELTSKFTAPVRAELDCDSSVDWVIRADLQAFDTPGDVKLDVSLSAAGTQVTDSRTILVREFNTQPNRNIILFIGDAMGTSYRDAARLVSRSVMDSTGKNSFRAGFFDNLLEMDKMPVSGMSMTYGTDSIVPDSANTGTAWATGNKSFLNAVNTLEDGTDCRWRFNGQTNAANLQYITDNPRVENLWQYLKRRYGYRAGIVSTAAITDATPAVEGAYVGFRQARLEIARQYRENPMLAGRPAFEVILGGGTDPFTASGRPDGRNLIAEFQDLGYRHVRNAAELRSVRAGQPVIGLFKGSASPSPASNGIATTADVNMDVAYDKLRMQRPASEPTANLESFTDQPMLDLMTQKAIEVLSSSFAGTPFILMVEAASIDKQSHPNQAAGTIWDAIEFDKAIGVGRAWAAARPAKDTLIVVTADHDQSMHIIGVSNVPDSEYFDRSKSQKVTLNTAANYTTAVAENNRLPLRGTPRPQVSKDATPRAVPLRAGEPSLIEHVVYIIKENRTYDQLFGDLKKGNGEPSFVLFGEDVTPNQRRLAENFVLLDNFYASGGNSADGHQWLTQANEVAYTLWPGYQGRSYPFDGTDPIAIAQGGTIWDAARKAGKSVRIYGEYAGRMPEPAKERIEYLQRWKAGEDLTDRWSITAPIAHMNAILARNYPSYTNSIPDVVRAQIFLKDLKGWEQNGGMPNLSLVQLPSDHTFGTSPGVSTPKAMVADNDLAVGQIVDALSKSKFWPKMAIFIVEDDAQNGVDHVDGHRTVALAVSPYIRRGHIDSTFYSNQSMVKTIELMLGLPTLSLFDLIAHEMRPSFTDTPDLTPYTHVLPRQDLFELNPPASALRGPARAGAIASAKMRWDVPDAAPTDKLNRILWHAVKGWTSPFPGVKSAIFAPYSLDIEDEDRE